MPLTKAQKIHRKYLLTEHWQNLRNEALERDGYKCSACYSTENLQVHHVIYRDRLEDGILEDLQTLCRNCHRSVHGLPVYQPREFDLLLKRLQVDLGLHSKKPSREDQVRLARLAEDEEDNREVEAFFRNLSGMRIILTSPRMWSSWLAKPWAVTSRMWLWARRKRVSFQTE